MRFCVLSSGSKGNACLVEHEDTRVLIDCGITPKRLRDRLAVRDLKIADLTAMVITHCHGDHTSGALKIGGAFKRRIYATKGTHVALSRRGGLPNFVPIAAGDAFAIGPLTFTAFRTPHDAPESVGYVISGGGARIGYVTDLGFARDNVKEALRDVDTLVLEFNYDEEMLRNGPYPPFLKRRVLSDRGHLSNAQAGELLDAVRTPRLRRVIMAHLSETNNTPQRAKNAALDVLRGSGVELVVAPQHYTSDWFDVVGSSGNVHAVAKKVITERLTSSHKSIAVRRQIELFTRR